MSTSQATRQLLLDTGLALAMEQGLSKLTVRGVTRRCGVNNGSFVYHFGSRDAFVGELVEKWYAPVLHSVRTQQARDMDPVERIRAMVLQSVNFVRSNSRFVALLITDALAGEKSCRDFIATLGFRHPRLLKEAILDAQEKQMLRAGPPENILVYLYAAVGVPVAFAELGKGMLPETFSLHELDLLLASPEAVEQRLTWALDGLKTQSGTNL